MFGVQVFGERLFGQTGERMFVERMFGEQMYPTGYGSTLAPYRTATDPRSTGDGVSVEGVAPRSCRGVSLGVAYFVMTLFGGGVWSWFYFVMTLFGAGHGGVSNVT